MIEKTVTVNNDAGIHCRPSSVIISAAQEHLDHEISITSVRGDSDLSSILGLLSLGLQKGDDVTIRVDGPNAEEVCNILAEHFATEFDFPPR
jgi:phosphocarrier protein